MTDPLCDNSMLASALAYAQMGISIFPCKVKSKLPATKHGFKDATTDPKQIETWWRQNPQFNIGIATGAVSRLLVIDVDPRNGGDIDALQNQFGDLPETPFVMTGGGGRQYYLAHPGGNIACSSGKLAPGIDVKSDGGYVVAPPSIHPSGIAYGWDDSATLGDVWPGSCPAWLVEQLARNSGTLPLGPTSCEPASDPIPPGQRNSTLASIAGHLRRAGLSRPAIEAALLKVNQERCQPPLDEQEIGRIAASVSRYDPDSVTVALVENHYDRMMGGQENTSNSPGLDPGTIPESLFKVPGFVSEVMDFTLSHAPYPNIGLAFCGAMALQSFLAGRKVCTAGDLRPNLYLLALASSGTGKDFPRKVNSQVLFEIGLVNALGDKFASGEGIQDALVRNPALLFQNDEMDGVLRQINLDRENRRESIPSVLMTLYTAANDVYPIRVKANQKETIHVDQPHLTLFGTATPQYFYESLSQRMLTNGFFARLMIVDIGKRSQGQTPGSARLLPDKIIRTASWWAEYQPGTRHGNLLNIHPEPKIVDFTSQAAEAMAQLQRTTEAEYNKAARDQDEMRRTAWSRTCENAAKLALIYACSENYENPVISISAVEWATAFARHQTRRQLYLAQSFVAENPFHAECLKLIRKLKESPDGQMARNRLMRAMRCKLADFEQITQTLVIQGDIVPVEIATKTKTAQGYRIA